MNKQVICLLKVCRAGGIGFYGVELSMKHRANLHVMEICANECPANNSALGLGKLQRCAKLVHFEIFGYHGELLVVFGSS